MLFVKYSLLAFLGCGNYGKSRTLHARTPATNLSEDLVADLALLWCAIYWKIIKNRGFQSNSSLFFHVFGPKNRQFSCIFYILGGGPKKLALKCSKRLVLVSHMIKYDVFQQI